MNEIRMKERCEKRKKERKKQRKKERKKERKTDRKKKVTLTICNLQTAKLKKRRKIER